MLVFNSLLLQAKIRKNRFTDTSYILGRRKRNMGSQGIDEKSFLEAYDIFAPKIFRHIYFRINSKEDAEDLTSQVFLKSWVYLKYPGREIENLKGFLYKTAHNLIVDYYRKKRKIPLPLNEEFENKFFYEKDIVQQINNQEELRLVRNAIKKLKKDFQEILVLRYIDDLSIEEIAHIIQKSKNAIYVTISRAVKELKIILQKDFPDKI